MGCTSADRASTNPDSPTVASEVAQLPQNQSRPAKSAETECRTTDNLLKDTEFNRLFGGVWNYSQHTGPISFDVTSDAGVLQVKRIGEEPYMVFSQRVPIPKQEGGRLKLLAEVKGALQASPPLAMEIDMTAGLYLSSSLSQTGSYSNWANHQPNTGDWDWRPILIEVEVAPGAAYAFAGVTHSARGSIWMRRPVLVWTDCS